MHIEISHNDGWYNGDRCFRKQASRFSVEVRWRSGRLTWSRRMVDDPHILNVIEWAGENCTRSSSMVSKSRLEIIFVVNVSRVLCIFPTSFCFGYPFGFIPCLPPQILKWGTISCVLKCEKQKIQSIYLSFFSLVAFSNYRRSHFNKNPVSLPKDGRPSMQILVLWIPWG